MRPIGCCASRRRPRWRPCPHRPRRCASTRRIGATSRRVSGKRLTRCRPMRTRSRRCAGISRRNYATSSGERPPKRATTPCAFFTPSTTTSPTAGSRRSPTSTRRRTPIRSWPSCWRPVPIGNPNPRSESGSVRSSNGSRRSSYGPRAATIAPSADAMRWRTSRSTSADSSSRRRWPAVCFRSMTAGSSRSRRRCISGTSPVCASPAAVFAAPPSVSASSRRSRGRAFSSGSTTCRPYREAGTSARGSARGFATRAATPSNRRWATGPSIPPIRKQGRSRTCEPTATISARAWGCSRRTPGR